MANKNQKKSKKQGSKTIKKIYKSAKGPIKNKKVKQTNQTKIKAKMNESEEAPIKKQPSQKSSNENFEDKIEEIRQLLKNNYIQQKKLMNDLKELTTIHKKEVKLTSKSGTRKNSGKHTGFNKPERVPISLRKLLKIEEEMMPRSKVTALMYQYFKDNKMFTVKTKRRIIPNEKIKEIFGMEDDDNITFYNLQMWLKKVYQENLIDDTVLKIDD